MKLLQLNWMLPILLACISSCFAGLEPTYEWKYVDYVWDSDAQKQDAIDRGVYDYTTIFPTDFQPLSDGRILIATPRNYNDNPASLSVISNQTGNGGPLLAPFPDWSWHTKSDCSGIISVSRVFLDDYDHLWFVDSGKIGNVQVCSAKIFKFDVQTDELVLQVDIPYNLAHNPDDETKGRLEIQHVEIADESDAPFWVYITDLDGYGIIMWDGSDMWRLNDEIFHPITGETTFTIGEESVDILGGPQGFALTPPGFLEQTYVILKPLSSYITYAVKTDDLKNSKLGYEIAIYKFDLPITTQEPAKTFTKSNNGLIFAGLTTQTAIICWNLRYPAKSEHLVTLETNSTTLQYMTSFKSFRGVKDGKDKLAVMSNRLQKFLLKTMDWEDINYRILEVETDEYVAGTACEPGPHKIEKSIEDKAILYYTSLGNYSNVPFFSYPVQV